MAKQAELTEEYFSKPNTLPISVNLEPGLDFDPDYLMIVDRRSLTPDSMIFTYVLTRGGRGVRSPVDSWRP